LVTVIGGGRAVDELGGVGRVKVRVEGALDGAGSPGQDGGDGIRDVLGRSEGVGVVPADGVVGEGVFALLPLLPFADGSEGGARGSGGSWVGPPSRVVVEGLVRVAEVVLLGVAHVVAEAEGVRISGGEVRVVEHPLKVTEVGGSVGKGGEGHVGG
jgi:hypothetical protein